MDSMPANKQQLSSSINTNLALVSGVHPRCKLRLNSEVILQRITIERLNCTLRDHFHQSE
jgi:hypothetical protein